MEGWRRALALAIPVTLAIVTAGALRRPEPVAEPGAPTTVSAPRPTTTIPPSTTSTTEPERDLEVMIGDMYFAWFDGVYRRDPAVIEPVAGVDAILDQWAVTAFDVVEFTAPPTRDAIGVTVKKVLLDRPDCLVVSADIDFSAFVDGGTTSTVDVYFPVGDGWGFASKYLYEKELWLADCDYLARR